MSCLPVRKTRQLCLETMGSLRHTTQRFCTSRLYRPFSNLSQVPQITQLPRGVQQTPKLYRRLHSSIKLLGSKYDSSTSGAVQPLIKDIFKYNQAGDDVLVQGWIRSSRSHKNVSFLQVSDGSCIQTIQVVIDHDRLPSSSLTTGSSVRIGGKLNGGEQQEAFTLLQGEWQRHRSMQKSSTSMKRIKTSLEGYFEAQPNLHILYVLGKVALPELQAESIEVVGECDPHTYPLQKKAHSLEFLREIIHLRPRTNTFGSATRVRNAASQAVHKYFQERGYIQVHTPIITANDTEGGGELFAISRASSEGSFFNTSAYLTVSGQLEAEMYACALSKVYTFGPTFRAENSQTSRHLAEFWMIEPEIAFAGLDEVVGCAEACVQSVVTNLQESAADDLNFFNERVDKCLLARLHQTIEKPFVRMTYTEAVDVLQRQKGLFKTTVEWGMDLATEHERFLAEKYAQRPIFITDYPKSLKPFYMRENDDGKTVAAVDLLVPGIGELVGGSVREERYDILRERMINDGVLTDEDLQADKSPGESLAWYLQLRKFGSVPHGGWGMGFERLVQYVTGLENIRDTIPVPRFPHYCRF